jgi:hypothetical protein
MTEKDLKVVSSYDFSRLEEGTDNCWAEDSNYSIFLSEFVDQLSLGNSSIISNQTVKSSQHHDSEDMSARKDLEQAGVEESRLLERFISPLVEQRGQQANLIQHFQFERIQMMRTLDSLSHDAAAGLRSNNTYHALDKLKRSLREAQDDLRNPPKQQNLRNLQDLEYSMPALRSVKEKLESENLVLKKQITQHENELVAAYQKLAFFSEQI